MVTGCYFVHRILSQEVFGFHDWYLFIGQAKTFLSTHMLYERDLSLYEPSAAIYKFPPLFVSILVFFLKLGCREAAIRTSTQAICFFCYFAALFICLRLTGNKNKFYLIPSGLILAFTFEPFFDNYDSGQMEIYILLLLALSLLCFTRQRDFLAGFLVGIAAAIKIYPIYFAGYYAAKRKYLALGGVSAGIASTLALSVFVAGWAEHLFYFMHIMPVLMTEAISGKGENLSLGHFLVHLNFSMATAGWMGLLFLSLPLLAIFCEPANRERPTIWFSVLIVIFLLATKNSWWNYQILLLIPISILLDLALGQGKIKYLFRAGIVIACFMIFWCNLGKLGFLIEWFGKLLDMSVGLTAIMLDINLLRGLGTFVILLLLLMALCTQNSKNISLVESKPST